MKKNKGFALMGVLLLLSFIIISLSGLSMIQMNEIKYRGKLMKDLKVRIEKFNHSVMEKRND